jgi:hypothetical protein
MNGKYDLDVMCGMYKMPLDGEWDEHVTAYHITRKSNIDSIRRNGIKATQCKATTYGDARISAVYLFAAKQDAFDKEIRAFLFGDAQDLAVVKVTVDKSHYHMMRDDGLFNASCGCSDGSYPFAIQYLDDIPADWIEVVA